METAQNELAQIEQRIIALKDSAARPGATGPPPERP